MAPNRLRVREDREKREATPFSDTSKQVNARLESPPNFTWVDQDELAGMGWPKSRDQIRFLITEGIDHLVTLSSDKIPPYYAFPELKWSLISVEDFSGPAIRDIQNFMNLVDKARINGEAVGVHCAEGRGRTGVMCACYLIYYHDLKPWDAIRVMRRQRPGSVERKTQEDTVVMFYKLIQDYGKQSLETLEQKEKEYKELQKLQRDTVLNSENVLLMHTASFYGPVCNTEGKRNRLEKLQRMARCRSMPKMLTNKDMEVEEINFRQHLQRFYHDDRVRPRERTETGDGGSSFQNRYSRSMTPGRALLENLKPIVPKSESIRMLQQPKNDLTRHFREFMSSNTSYNENLKRSKSLKQSRDSSGFQSNETFRKEERNHELERTMVKKGGNIDTDDRQIPPHPTYIPNYSIDSSSTYSYYTRLRNKGNVSKKMKQRGSDVANDRPALLEPGLIAKITVTQDSIEVDGETGSQTQKKYFTNSGMDCRSKAKIEPHNSKVNVKNGTINLDVPFSTIAQRDECYDVNNANNNICGKQYRRSRTGPVCDDGKVAMDINSSCHSSSLSSLSSMSTSVKENTENLRKNVLNCHSSSTSATGNFFRRNSNVSDAVWHTTSSPHSGTFITAHISEAYL